MFKHTSCIIVLSRYFLDGVYNILSLIINTVIFFLKILRLKICNFYIIVHCVLLISRQYNVGIFDIKMKWGDEDTRIAVIAINDAGLESNNIFKILHMLGTSYMMVYRTTHRYNET